MVMQIARLQPQGINLDIPRHLVGPEVWTAAQNMLFDRERSRVTLGYTHSTNAPPAVPLDMTYIRAGGNDYWFYMTAVGMGYWDGVNHTDLTPAGYSPSGEGHFVRVHNNVPIFNNRGGQPHYWDFVAAEALPLPGWQFGTPNWVCDEVVPFSGFLFALKMQEDTAEFSDVKIRWSDVSPAGSVPTEWIPTTTNRAGDTALATPEGAIVGAMPLRSRLMVYKDNSTHEAAFIGGSFTFVISKNFETIGLLAPRAVVELDNSHIMMTQDDIIRHDGVSLQSISTERVRAYVYDDLSTAYKHRAYLVLNRLQDSVYIFYPSKASTGLCDRMLQYNFVTDKWGERRFIEEVGCAATGSYVDDVGSALTWDTWTQAPNTWHGLTGTWDYDGTSAARNRMILGAVGPSLWKVGGSTDNGATIPAFIEKTNIDLGKSERRKLISRVWPNFETGTGLRVNIYVGAGEANGEPAWGQPQQFRIGFDKYVNGNVSGKAMALRIEALDAGSWSFSSVEIEFREQGRH